jgi:uncharacterized protein (DUF697 family)
MSASIRSVEPAPPVATDHDGAVAHSAEETVSLDTDKIPEAMALIKQYISWSIGAGGVPVPLLDMTALLAVQLRMISKLVELYNIPYSEQRSKEAVTGLTGGFDTGYFGGSALRMFPIMGIFSFAAMPAINAAITYAVGKVLIQHFESGGTFLDFDPEKVKTYFKANFCEGISATKL